MSFELRVSMKRGKHLNFVLKQLNPMKLWKIMVLLPYVGILILTAYILHEISKPGAGLLAGLALLLPIYLFILYTIVLGVALFARWLILRLRKL